MSGLIFLSFCPHLKSHEVYIFLRLITRIYLSWGKTIFIEYIWCKAIQKDGDIIGCHPIGVLVLGLGDAVPIERIYIQAVPGGLLCNGVKGILLVRINSAVV